MTVTRLSPRRATPLSPEQQKLVESHLHVIEQSIAKLAGKASRFFSREDLRGFGHEGLVQAAQTFERGAGVPFEAFARYRVEGAMLDALRREDRQQRLPWAVRAASRRHLAMVSDPSDVMHDSDDDTRKHLAKIAEAHAAAMMAAFEAEALRGDEEAAVAERQQHKKALETVAAARAALPVRDRQIIELYYHQDKELKEIGQTLGVSYASVRRYHDGVLARLGAELRVRGIHGAGGDDR